MFLILLIIGVGWVACKH